MDVAILGSDEGGGSTVNGITGGVYGVAGRAEGATSGMGFGEATTGGAWAGGVISTGISTTRGSSGCSRCGIFGCSSPAGAPWSAP